MSDPDEVDIVVAWKRDWTPEYRRKVAERIWLLRSEACGLDLHYAIRHGLGDCVECDAMRIIESHR